VVCVCVGGGGVNGGLGPVAALIALAVRPHVDPRPAPPACARRGSGRGRWARGRMGARLQAGVRRAHEYCVRRTAAAARRGEAGRHGVDAYPT
jgi:hypothetical protein